MKREYEVLNIKCGGCAGTITRKLSEQFEGVEVDVGKGVVAAEITGEEREAELRRILRGLGYPMADEKVGFVEGNVLKAKSFVSCAVGRVDNAKEGKEE